MRLTSMPCLLFQGFLKNERDNALLSAIEESRRRVSVFLHYSTFTFIYFLSRSNYALFVHWTEKERDF